MNGIFLPTIDLMSDPDYVNQNIAWFVSIIILEFNPSNLRYTFFSVK